VTLKVLLDLLDVIFSKLFLIKDVEKNKKTLKHVKTWLE